MMQKKLFFVFIVALLPFMWACVSEDTYQVNETYSGFTLIEKQFVDEVNAECLLFEHKQSGARLFKIIKDDPNKFFTIAFKTVPEHDYGTPHILEHSVLNGSKKFPVKSPFDVLYQGSLNTYLNALTGSDITYYPVASMNDKDYFNLMDVYLDAVFNPLIYDDPRIFQQEGWHYELTDKDEDIVYKGVVYNEMKGAYSSSYRNLWEQVIRNLFPDNTYGVSSGGYPTEIPKLDYEAFLDFHRKYYNPSNSYIFLYGNADTNEELQFIDSLYLSSYTNPGVNIEIPKQQPLDSLTTIVSTYPAPEGSPVEGQTLLSIDFVTGEGTDVELDMALEILAEALVNHESAPLRLALQEAGIGQEVEGYFNEMKQNIFEITVYNANPEDVNRFRQVIFNTLEQVSKEGFDKTMIQGILNRMEFNLKEGNDPQQGMMYFRRLRNGWFFADDPFLELAFNEPLEKIKEGINNNILESTIENYMLNNPHAVLVALNPEPGLQAKIDAGIRQELADYKAGLSETEIEELIASTNELIEYQQIEDTPEALATIPMLELSDISRDIEWFGIEEKSESDIPVLFYDEFTNSILYSDFYFDMRVLPQELIPYASLLSSILGKLNTENYTFGELDNALNIYTGGFGTTTSNYLEERDDEKLVPKFVVSAKATSENATKMFDLVEEVLTNSDYSDVERLEELISRNYSNLISDIQENGFYYSIYRLRSYFSKSGMMIEQTYGYEYFRFVKELAEHFEENSNEIIEKLTETADLLFARDNLVASVTCSDSDYPIFASGMQTLSNSLPEENQEYKDWQFEYIKKNEALSTASMVQYVVKGYNYKDLGYLYTGKLLVLQQILSTEWFQNQIRIIGGAYGGFSSFSSSGNVYFGSYRDPNLTETINIYDQTPDYLSNFDADDNKMKRFIIGTISELDQPLTVSQRGDRAVSYYFRKITAESLKEEREDVLSTTQEDIREMGTMVKGLMDQNALCVYGNEEIINENADIFGDIINISE